MIFNKNSLLLYAITDRHWLNGRSLFNDVELALKGGATMIQLREKGLEENSFLDEAFKIKKLCSKYNVPLIIDDNVQLALQCNADGVHLGQSDMDCKMAREVLGTHKIIGVTAKTVEQALVAEKNGADYLGSGAMFGSTTKSDAVPMTTDTLKNICHSVSIPVCAIGGINNINISQLKDTGINGVAVISSIFGEKDIYSAAKGLYNLSKCFFYK